MKHSNALAFALVLLLVTPRPAAAAEDAEPQAPVMLVRPDVLAPLPLFGVEPAAVRSAVLAPSPAEIRMSRGAKTVLIVAAIVVGVALVAGVLVVARPWHP